MQASLWQEAVLCPSAWTDGTIQRWQPMCGPPWPALEDWAGTGLHSNSGIEKHMGKSEGLLAPAGTAVTAPSASRAQSASGKTV